MKAAPPAYVWNYYESAGARPSVLAVVERRGRDTFHLHFDSYALALLFLPWCRLWDPKPAGPYADYRPLR